jgi:hypothetical protein
LIKQQFDVASLQIIASQRSHAQAQFVPPRKSARS